MLVIILQRHVVVASENEKCVGLSQTHITHRNAVKEHCFSNKLCILHRSARVSEERSGKNLSRSEMAMAALRREGRRFAPLVSSPQHINALRSSLISQSVFPHPPFPIQSIFILFYFFYSKNLTLASRTFRSAKPFPSFAVANKSSTFFFFF